VAQSGAFPDRENKEAERLVAAIFSSTMREYSAGEHFPHAIMRPRRPTVSHDAHAISIIITGSEAGLRRVRLVISERWPITTETASSDGARSSHAGARSSAVTPP
jgi:adenine-specific DNA methylase